VGKNGSNLFEGHDVDTAAFLLSVYQHFKLNYPKFYKMDNLSKLGWLASEILLKDDFKPHLYQPEQVGIVLANANSSLDDDIKYYASVSDVPSPSLFVYTLPNIMIGEICIRNNFKGEHALFVQEKFDTGFIESQVNYLLDNDLLEACICGWVDVLEQDYKAVLFLVEKEKGEQSLPFSKDNLNNIFINN
jgi:ribosomal protein L30E